MSFCLMPSVADKFKEMLRSGEIDPGKLNDMSSAERHKFFSGFMGEDAAGKTNALFESKILLKNQQQGFINWAKNVSGIKPEVRKDILARINRLDKVLNPSEHKAFLEDLASQKLGISVSVSEAAKIADLAKKAEKFRGDAVKGKDRLAYGKALVDFNNYFNSLKEDAQKLTFKDLKANPLGTAKEAFVRTAGASKSLKASLDNSALFRQGLKPMWTHPKIWLNNSLKSFSDMYKTFGGKNVMDEVHADILSRPNALNGLYQKEKLAIGTGEEVYPTSLPEKVPGLGKLFKASENAYKGFIERTRADIFDKYVDIAKKSGGDIKGIGKLVNSLTGRSDLPFGLERSASTINNVFFSPRFLKSQIDFLTAHQFDRSISPFARKQAALNLLKVVGGTAAVLTIANAAKPGSVEWDPRSSDFGKIKIGDTRFDVTGGISSLVTLASRIATASSKSSTSGNVTKLNSGNFGSKSTGDVVVDFFANKLSPAAGVVRDIANQQDRERNPVTVPGELKNLFAPLPITNAQEMINDPNSAPLLIGLIADALGISTNTYSGKKTLKKAK